MLKKKWGNIRDNFIKYRNKLKQATRSGAGAYNGKKYIYYEMLLFLLPTVDGDDTEDTFYDTTDDNVNNVVDQENGGNGNIVGRNEQEEEAEDWATAELRAADSAQQRKKKIEIGSRNRKLDPVQMKILEVLQEQPEKPNRHASFFSGIIPSLDSFSDDEVLDFQQGVLSVIQNIKKKRSNPGFIVTESTRNSFSPHHSRMRRREPYPRARSLEAVYYDSPGPSSCNTSNFTSYSPGSYDSTPSPISPLIADTTLYNSEPYLQSLESGTSHEYSHTDS